MDMEIFPPNLMRPRRFLIAIHASFNFNVFSVSLVTLHNLPGRNSSSLINVMRGKKKAKRGKFREVLSVACGGLWGEGEI